MEKLSDFFSELKERISNPFILSYLIGWCIWNYKIPVGLIFYKNGELKNDGYQSYLDLIQKNSSAWHYLWLPLFSALAYTFLFPFVKNLILAFGAWIDTWGNNWNLNISKTSKVSSEKYLQYKVQFEEALEKISKFANDEQKFKGELIEAQEQKNQLSDALQIANKEREDSISFLNVQLNKALEDIKSWQLANSITYLDGEWYFKITNTVTQANNVKRNDIKEYNVIISNGAVQMTQENQITTTLYITNILCNYVILQVYLSSQRAEYPGSDASSWIFRLDKNKGIKTLYGKDNYGVSLELRNRTLIVPPELSQGSSYT